MRLLIATQNQNKVREIREILEGSTKNSGLELVGLDEIVEARGAPIEEPVEDGLSFEENARIKARYYAKATGLVAIAEDSGLEVDALDGAPGIHSARYAGVGESREERDRANNEKLLRELEGAAEAERAARFVCALSVVSSTGEVLYETRGEFEGRIGTEPRGDGGFGYDPLLFIPELGKTSAELTSEEKNARSHRGAAFRALAKVLPSLLATLSQAAGDTKLEGEQ